MLWEECVNDIIQKEHIYSGILAGADNISMSRVQLNAANAFPVPDNDTGDNLAYLMNHIVKEIKVEPSIKLMLTNVSNAAILGARGNSGAIFSQFFTGFERVAPSENSMTLDDFVYCFQNGYEHAAQAIEHPVEGTIITAIRAWTDALKNGLTYCRSLGDLSKKALDELNKTVASTKIMLKEQKEYGVEDAGAIAFLRFIEGFMKMIVGRESYYQRARDDYPVPELVAHPTMEWHDGDHRYCTEVLLRKNQPVDASMLNVEGDSLVMSQNQEFLRVHMHTNFPSSLVERMAQLGDILETKADDMKLQSQANALTKQPMALLIDSIADLPQSFPSFVYMLPIHIMVDNVSYDDKRTVYSSLLEKKKATSAHPSQQEVDQMLTRLLSAYEEVIILTVSSKMSGIYQRYHQSKVMNHRVHLVDTKLNSVAEGLVVYHAIQAIQNQQSLAQTLAKIRDVADRTKIFVGLKQLKEMIASGRLHEKIGWVLQKLHFLPLITINREGVGKIRGVAFTKRKNIRLLYDSILKHRAKIESYAVVYSDNKEEAERMAVILTKEIGFPPLYLSQISSGIRIYSGSGSIAIGYTMKGES